MSDNDPPKHKMVDGVLVELTSAEIDEIMRERDAAKVEPEAPPETRTTANEHGRAKRR